MGQANLVTGIDEVGRGCLAGPLVAAAVVLKDNIPGLADSKKLNKQKRQELDKAIRAKAVGFGIGWTEIEDINKHGLTFAVSNAMKSALSQIKVDYDKIIIDGNYNYLPNETKVELLIRADEKIPAVSAASIIAKVYRDKWMSTLAKEFPGYGFEKHVGYGTKLHFEKLELYGPCRLHRMFYKPLLKYS